MALGSESFYIDALSGDMSIDVPEWLASFENQVRNRPFENPLFTEEGSSAPALRYDPATRNLFVNRDHPFIDKLTSGGKHQGPGKLFASTELLLECQLEDNGMSKAAIASLLENRDRVLRLTAGDAATTAREVMRRLSIAKQDSEALEVAVGTAFQALGFEYERKGKNASGPDGVLYARLGRHGDTSADYTLVYDAKQTNEPSVPADKVDLLNLERFRQQARADYGFFAAVAYQAEDTVDGKLNDEVNAMSDCKLTLLKVNHLTKLVWLHYKHGVPLTSLRRLFEEARTVPEVDEMVG